jgi:drug/metabolite transporter (DMT)-like permease
MIALWVFLVVVPGSLGDVMNSVGMKRHGEITDFSPLGLLHLAWDMLRNPWIMGSIPPMAISFFALMALLSTEPVSFAVPVTASSYILETAVAKWWLREAVDWRRWVGTLLVAVGVVLISL